MMSHQRFLDCILQSPHLREEERSELGKAVVVVGDNVSNYYWQESDQERWTFDDFPNVAPPFPLFWLDFHHPEFINSKEYGDILVSNSIDMFGHTVVN